jgi:osmotically inducible protein OsmC
MKRSASAVWTGGGVKAGSGHISSESGVLSNARYGFTSRFENEKGTNPEELIAAAHASCFSMALSGKLEEAGLIPESIQTKATLSLDKLDAGWTVTAIHLDVTARVPGADAAKFQAAAEKAKSSCPISRLLGAAATITMEARLRELAERHAGRA